jgi:hypothetical protein
MSKRHQASRRRSYGRRQHELHERPERPADALGWYADSGSLEADQRWIAEPAADTGAGNWLQLQRIG